MASSCSDPEGLEYLQSTVSVVGAPLIVWVGIPSAGISGPLGDACEFTVVGCRHCQAVEAVFVDHDALSESPLMVRTHPERTIPLTQGLYLKFPGSQI